MIGTFHDDDDDFKGGTAVSFNQPVDEVQEDANDTMIGNYNQYDDDDGFNGGTMLRAQDTVDEEDDDDGFNGGTFNVAHDVDEDANSQLARYMKQKRRDDHAQNGQNVESKDSKPQRVKPQSQRVHQQHPQNGHKYQ